MTGVGRASQSLWPCIISLTEEMELFNTADGTSGSMGRLSSRLVWTPNSAHQSKNLRDTLLSSRPELVKYIPEVSGTPTCIPH